MNPTSSPGPVPQTKVSRTISDQNDKPVRILLVEDNEIDAMAVRRAFRKMSITNPITHAIDGIEALQLLRGDGADEPLAPPYLVLLDLNMPRMNGIEFLSQLRTDQHLKRTIVFVLTTSDDEQDMLRAYDANIAGYLVKEKIGEDFVNLVNLLDTYWRFVEFPPQG